MSRDKEHSGGVDVMSGEFHYHMGLVNCFYPYGLHREFYRVVDFGDDDFDWLSDGNLVFVKVRVSCGLLR